MLNSFVAAIRNGVTLPDGSQLEEKTCFLSFYQEPYRFPDTLFVTVAPGYSSFGEGFQIGGGAKQCTEEMGVDITIWSRYPPTQVSHDASSLTDPVRGLYQIKGRILRALVAIDLAANYPPGTQGVNQFQRELLIVTGCDAPEHVIDEKGNNFKKLVIHFRISWDWDLTS